MRNRMLVILFLVALLLCGVLLRAADNGKMVKTNQMRKVPEKPVSKDMELVPNIVLL